MSAAWFEMFGAMAALTALAVLLPSPARWISVVHRTAAGHSSASGTAALWSVAPVAETAMLLVAAAFVWTLLLWSTVVALVAVAGRLPGGVGSSSRAMLARIAPGLIRRVVLTAVGASVVTGLAACGTSVAAASTPVDLSHPAGHPSAVSVTGAAVAGVGRSGPDASWTSVEGSAVLLASDLLDPAAGSEAGSTGQMDIDWPTLPAHSVSTAPRAPVDIDWPHAGPTVVVLRGDSLWSIAARHLPPGATSTQVEIATHAWYVANAPVIGDNPNLILPGQILQPPNLRMDQRP